MEGLAIKADGTYVDVTYGGGGHAAMILDRIKNGKLIAFDQDADAKRNNIADDRLVFVADNFRHLKINLNSSGVEYVDGILADLGISSHQIDSSGRGFSTRSDEPLDMRMSKESTLDAKEVVNTYSEQELANIFKAYGELQSPYKVARAITHAREKTEINTSGELLKAVERLAPPRKEFKFFAQVFQAIRIEVNNELENLKELLLQSAEMLKTGGRLVVISYHSLEDRLVKNFMRSGNFDGTVQKDFYGNPRLAFSIISKKPLVPSERELQLNNRSRSAKLRVAERIR